MCAGLQECVLGRQGVQGVWAGEQFPSTVISQRGGEQGALSGLEVYHMLLPLMFWD